MTGQTERLRVALIGPGRIAIAHLEAIAAARDAAQLVAIAGLPSERARTEALVERYGAERAVDDTDAILAADDIDAVVVTVPNDLHAPLCLELLAAGKHVLVEKPLATNVADTDRMIEAADEHGRVLMAGQCRRWFDGAQEAKRRVAQLGRPLSIVHFLGVYVERPQTDWWKSSTNPGGLAMELNGPHVLDTILWLVDAVPTRVYARSRRLRDHWQGDDEVVLVIDFADGSMATGYISLSTRPAVNDRWITGPAGSLKLTDDRNLWVDGVPVVEEPVTPYLDGDVSFERQFREFMDAVRTGREPVAAAREVRPLAVVMEAAERSQRTGEPIELSQDALPATGTTVA